MHVTEERTLHYVCVLAILLLDSLAKLGLGLRSSKAMQFFGRVDLSSEFRRRHRPFVLVAAILPRNGSRWQRAAS